MDEEVFPRYRRPRQTDARSVIGRRSTAAQNAPSNPRFLLSFSLSSCSRRLQHKLQKASEMECPDKLLASHSLSTTSAHRHLCSQRFSIGPLRGAVFWSERLWPEEDEPETQSCVAGAGFTVGELCFTLSAASFAACAALSTASVRRSSAWIAYRLLA